MAGSKLALEVLAPVLLEQSVVVGVGVHSNGVKRVELTGAVEHILVDLSVEATERAVELPVGEVPGVDETDRVGTDLLKELHDGAGTGELDLADGDGGGGVELAGLLLEGVESVEAEELVHKTEGLGVHVA